VAACVNFPHATLPHHNCLRRPLITCAGVAWSSSVHLLGVYQRSAASARSVHEVAAAVNPDAVGYEYDSSDSIFRNMMKEAAQSAPMMKLVNRLMDTPLDSYQQAHGQLTAGERKEWEAGLNSAGAGLPEAELFMLHNLGMPSSSDFIAGVCMRA
jgi:hypothetical protein